MGLFMGLFPLLPDILLGFPFSPFSSPLATVARPASGCDSRSLGFSFRLYPSVENFLLIENPLILFFLLRRLEVAPLRLTP